MNKRNIIINSTMLFVIATICQLTLHETGHFIAAICLHSKDVTLYHNYVQHDLSELSTAARITVASAGPLFSLLLGVLFHIICASYRKRNLRFLFCLFMSAFGYINFGGYLLVAPFFIGGDTGFVFHELGFPLWLIILLAAGGAAFLFFAMKKLSRFFVEMAGGEIVGDAIKRKAFITALVEYPLYTGVVITTLLNLPVVVFLSLLYPLFSPFTLFWGFGYLLKAPYAAPADDKGPDRLNTISPVLIAVLVLTIICNRLLVFGLHW